MLLISKMNKKHILCSLLLYSLLIVANAQSTIQGYVVDSTQKEAIVGVQVFLNNTQKGNLTDANGYFEIENVSEGNYEIVASFIGYKTYIQPIKITKNANLNLRISLSPQTIELKEVTITEDKHWEDNYLFFCQAFLGTTPNALQCEIKNPKALKFFFDAPKRELTAYAKDFLIIENKALGYQIKYKLEDFALNFELGYQTYWGNAFFQEIETKNKKKQKQWAQNRAQAYYGSLTHFLKAVHHQNYREEGFWVRKLQRIPNRNRLSDDIIQKNLQNLMQQKYSLSSDTMQYWQNELKKPRITEILHSELLPPDSISTPTDSSMVLLQFNDYLHIIYQHEPEDPTYSYQRKQKQTAENQSSVLRLVAPYAIIDKKGILLNPLTVVSEEYWAWQEKVAEMLPYDYQPPENK